MSDLPRVKVVNPDADWLGTEYYINNQKIERVRAVDFRVAVDEVPTFTFETMGLPDIDMPGDIRFSFTPETVNEAAAVLRNELLKHEDLYDGKVDAIWKKRFCNALSGRNESVRLNKGQIKRFLKQLFCKHDYERRYLHKIKGGMEKLYRCQCKKCGKAVYRT